MKVKLYKNRKVLVESYSSEKVGTQYERNATKLEFDFFDVERDLDLSESITTIHFFHDDLTEENYLGDTIIHDNEYSVSSLITKYENVLAFVQIIKEDELLWKSEIFELKFNKSLNVDKTLPEEQKNILGELISDCQQIKTDVELGKYDGKQGPQGIMGPMGPEGPQGPMGPQGLTGSQGIKGKDGYTPQKGKDYFTEQEQNEFTQLIQDNVEEQIDNITPKNKLAGEKVLISDALNYKLFETTIHGNYEQNITTGKNLLANNLKNQNLNGISIAVNEDKSISLNGTSTARTVFYLCENVNYSLDPNESYTLKKAGIGTGVIFQIGLKSDTNTIYKSAGDTDNTFVLDEARTITYYALIVESGITIENKTVYPQLEKNNHSTEYEQFTNRVFTPNTNFSQKIKPITGEIVLKVNDFKCSVDLKENEFLKLPNEISDDIVIDKYGKVYLIKKVKKLILTGNESFVLNEIGDGYARYTLLLNDLVDTLDSSKKHVISDYFLASSSSETVNAIADEDRICVVTKQRILIKTVNSELLTLEKFKSWLSQNNVTIYYELIEPEIILLGNVEEQMRTTEDLNNISIETNVITSLEVEYAQSLQKVIENQQSQINNLVTLLSAPATSALLLDNYASDLESEV